ncbi:hypothetical protein BIW11_06041 [Tropilaelaps mercedesae]|uniref:histone acetyltransferase n=1 Tax=Tropilaelaps mercedesae TaxID=418985 RepID=A0A1V9XZU3_9ACAR|nr:hypothetical protein BIW11_06041 [Tropilaelaps mercedesae]
MAAIRPRSGRSDLESGADEPDSTTGSPDSQSGVQGPDSVNYSSMQGPESPFNGRGSHPTSTRNKQELNPMPDFNEHEADAQIAGQKTSSGGGTGGRTGLETGRQQQSMETNGERLNPEAGTQGLDPSIVEKGKIVRQHLLRLLHAYKCQKRELQNSALGMGETGVQRIQCMVPYCLDLRTVLRHIPDCTDGTDCKFMHCVASCMTISHWKECTCEDCPVCANLKRPNGRGQENQPNRQNQPPTPAQKSMGLTQSVTEEVPDRAAPTKADRVLKRKTERR